MRNYCLFDDQEEIIAEEINKKLGTENGYLLQLFDVLNNHLDTMDSKLKTNQFPEHTILNIVTQNLQLLNNAYILYTKGYLRSPGIILRTVAEQLILSMYFKEYPDIEEEFRTIDYYIFNRKYPIKEMMEKIDKEGKFFRVKERDKFLQTAIFEELYKQMNLLSHTDANIVNNVMMDEITGKYHKGPRLQQDDILKGTLRLIFMSTIFTLIVVDTTFNIARNEKEAEITKAATELINYKLITK